MKRMKNYFSLLLCSVLFTTMIIVPQNVHAETLGSMKAKLNKLEADYQAQVKEQKETEGKITQNKNTIAGMKASIAQLEKEIKALEAEIKKFEQQIKAKEAEIKSVINFMQVSNGENAYLEYALGAQDFTDFIYRMSVSEQLAEYNRRLSKEYQSMIKQNAARQDEMDQKKVQLTEEKARLEQENQQMTKHLDEVASIQMDIKEEIRLQKDAIKVWQNKGCRDNEELKACQQRILDEANQNAANQGGPSNSTTSTAFLRPIVTGYVTSEYGWRKNPFTGVNELHEAMDVAQTGYVPIYAAAPGVVIGTRVRSSCGGNMIFIVHTINGKKYTTEYAHLRSINVSIGQYVTANTQIAVMGGDKKTEWWDSCSSVQHLHFGIASGHYLIDYTRWNDFLNHTYDPRKTVNFPWSGGSTDYFANRTTIY